MKNWYITDRALEIPTPALLIYPDRIEENIRRMIRIAGSPEKLRPHVKTHKMFEVVKLQVAHGISKFKCSTVSEADMTASAGGKDILLAVQPVGIQIDRFLELRNKYPQTKFSVIVDNIPVALEIAQKTKPLKAVADLWLDINNGMNRTGIIPDKSALQVYQFIAGRPELKIHGLHVYDGHIHERELIDRHVKCEGDFEAVRFLIGEIIKSGLAKPMIIAGGTPTFPIHAKRTDTETSPGTCLLWDSGYEEKFPDLSFQHGAVLLSRIVSKPADNLLCLDLGHKAIAAEMPHPRIRFFTLTAKRFVNHSEEHLVLESEQAGNYQCGDLVYGVPWHVCPTVPRYPFAYTVRNNRINGRWNVDARDR